jgi:hypothetical protein
MCCGRLVQQQQQQQPTKQLANERARSALGAASGSGVHAPLSCCAHHPR